VTATVDGAVVVVVVVVVVVAPFGDLVVAGADDAGTSPATGSTASVER
jgi:hypothetical protein